ncbi:MAG: hypothetical protein SGJ18_14000 [Pseudomonadota bacterium]|nr:hypothetical protein [Pseudomonadota bacterium]
MRKLIFAISLFCSQSFASQIVCSHFQGPESNESLAFVGEVAFLNGEKMPCGRIPVRFSTIRNFEGRSVAITFTCGTGGGGIYGLGPTPVGVLTEGWMGNLESFYALIGKTYFKCGT